MRGPEPPWNCPPPETWFLLVDNALSRDEEEAAVRHTVTCLACTQLLREANLQADSEASPHPEPLPSDDPSRIRAFQAEDEARWRLLPRRWALGGLATAAALAAAWFVFLPKGSNQPTAAQWQQLASDRMIEFRLSAAPYGPFNGTRGPEAQEELPSVESSTWLEELRRGRLEAARKQLETAGEPSTPEALSDLAALTAAVGDRNRSPAAYESALRLLDRALQMNPAFSPASFNRALVLSRLGRSSESQAEWARFRQMERDAQWRAEADLVVH